MMTDFSILCSFTELDLHKKTKSRVQKVQSESISNLYCPSIMLHRNGPLVLTQFSPHAVYNTIISIITLTRTIEPTHYALDYIHS